jgi:hypothetical protein
MKKAIIAAALAACASAVGAMDWNDWIKAAQGQPIDYTYFRDGNRLQADRTQDRASFVNYVVGVIDGQRGREGYCLPQGVTAGQMADVVGVFLEKRPEVRHWNGERLVAAALREAFPCAQPPSPSR